MYCESVVSDWARGRDLKVRDSPGCGLEYRAWHFITDQLSALINTYRDVAVSGYARTTKSYFNVRSRLKRS